MGHATRTMTRQSKSQRQANSHQKFVKRNRDINGDGNDADNADQKEKNLKLIKLTDQQEKTDKLKFVYDLPKTLKDLKVLLADQSEEDQMIIIQRIREYHNPEVNTKAEAAEKFTIFIINLLRYYLKQEKSPKSISKHLKELCSWNGSIFASYMKTKLVKVVQSIKMIRDGETQNGEQSNEERVKSLLESIVELQRVFIEILECPENSKLLEVIEQTCSHLYMISEKIMKGNVQEIVSIATNDIQICQSLKKKFNPAITNIVLRLATLIGKKAHSKNVTLLKSFISLYYAYKQLLKDTGVAPQLQIIEVNKALKASLKNIPSQYSQSLIVDDLDQDVQLVYLQLLAKKLKPLPTFAPLIEEDFMTFKDLRGVKKPIDEKEMKRKLKKNQNHALRELRKDTTMIQVQREQEMSYKRNQYNKTVYKAGTIKDEM
eukprot:403373534